MIMNTLWVLCAFVESKAAVTSLNWLFCFTGLYCSSAPLSIHFKGDIGLMLFIFKMLKVSMTSLYSSPHVFC